MRLKPGPAIAARDNDRFVPVVSVVRVREIFAHAARRLNLSRAMPQCVADATGC